MLLLPKKIGSYTLRRKLGTGGVAESYVGTHDSNGGRPVVVRRILPYVARDPSRLASVEARIKDLLGVRHPFLVHVLESVTEGDEHFVVEEHIDGVNLDKVLSWCRQNQRPIPHNVFLNIATQVCNGLEALHGRSGKGTSTEHVLHLALKPNSIFVTRDGKVMVGGYGLTRSPTTLPHGGVAGPVPTRMEYLSPEQTHPDQKLAPASDIFALGAVLYELLTLDNLFRADSNLQTIHRVRRAEVTSQLLRVKELMPGLDKVLYRALSLNPRHRYQRAFVLREDLRGLMAGYSFATIAEDTRNFLEPLLESIAPALSRVDAAPDAPPNGDGFNESPITHIDFDPMGTAAAAAEVMAGRQKATDEARVGAAAAQAAEAEAAEAQAAASSPNATDLPGAGAFPEAADVPSPSLERTGEYTGEFTESTSPRGAEDPPTEVRHEAIAPPNEDLDRPTLPGSDLVAARSEGTVPGEHAARLPPDPTVSYPDVHRLPPPAPLALQPLASAAPNDTAPSDTAPNDTAPKDTAPNDTAAFLARGAEPATPVAVSATDTAAFLRGGALAPMPPPAPLAAPVAPPPTLSRPMPGPGGQSVSRPMPPPGGARPAKSASNTVVPLPEPVPAAAPPAPPDAAASPPERPAAPERPPVAAQPTSDPSLYEEPSGSGSSGILLVGGALVALAAVALCAGVGWTAWNSRTAETTVATATPAAPADGSPAVATPATNSDAASVMADAAPPRVEPIDDEPAAPATPATANTATPTPAPATAPASTASSAPTTNTASAPPRSNTAASSASNTSASSTASRPAASSSPSSARTSSPAPAASTSRAASTPTTSSSASRSPSSSSSSESSSARVAASRTAPTPTAAPVATFDSPMDVSVEETPVSDLDQFVDAAKKGKLASTDIAVLGSVDVQAPDYTRSRALLLMNAQRKGDDKATRGYLDELMLLPENQYNPVYLTDYARWHVNHAEYDKALDRATLAERYWARIPPELVFTKKAEIYEIQAAAWQGKFYKSDEDMDMLSSAIKGWERYRQHVATRSRADLQKRADAELARLQDIREKLQ